MGPLTRRLLACGMVTACFEVAALLSANVRLSYGFNAASSNQR